MAWSRTLPHKSRGAAFSGIEERQVDTQDFDESDVAWDLEQARLADARVSEMVTAGRGAKGREIATERAAAALSDLAVLRRVDGAVGEAVDLLKQALTLWTTDRRAFHNLVVTLFTTRSLRGPNLDAVLRHLQQLGPEVLWAGQYRRLLYAPRFLNVEFVLGKCNLSCRMCLGGHRKDKQSRFEYMTAEDFRRTLASAPTVAGATLSSGDSEPLLHPQFEQLLEIALQHRVLLDVFTNGLALNARRCRKLVESQTVSMINFSVDAATAETYRRIRGEDLGRLLRKIEMLQSMKNELKLELPRLSLSFVAMDDNIQELPAFVALAAGLGAGRVYVEELIGWEDKEGPNHPATDNPQWRQYVEEARRRASENRLLLELPGTLRFEQSASADLTAADETASAPDEAPPSPRRASLPARLRHCGWLWGVWVQKDGRLDPCCLVHDVVDMGNIHEGPLLMNKKFTRVKELLLRGKVFPECAGQRACAYVQQQQSLGRPLQIITGDELGEPCARRMRPVLNESPA
jgi:MoaA/NifB/PqqE/SkfB family radical SAM enzyme